MYVPGLNLGATQPKGLVALSYINPRSSDERVAEGSKSLLADIRRAYPVPDHLRAKEAEMAKKLARFRADKSGLSLLEVREALSPDLFDIFLRRTVHIKVLDGQATPTFQDWRMLASIVPFSDFELNESIRFESPSDLLARKTAKGPVDFEEIDELEMPSWRGEFFSRGFEINFETTTIEGLTAILMSRFSDGTSFNRTVQRFVFDDLLEGNPTITVDGVSQDLFDTTHSFGTSNDLNAAVTAFSIAELEDMLALMSLQTIDGNEVSLTPRWIVVKENSLNHIRAAEVIQGTLRPSLGTSTSAPTALNIMGSTFNLGIITSPTLAANSWFVVADPTLAPGFALELGFFGGQDSPQVVDVDRSGSSYFNLNQSNRWVIRTAFGGTWRDFRGVYRGSPVS